MTDKQIIGLLEQATGSELDENRVKGLIDQRVELALSRADPRRIPFGQADGPGTGLSKYLGEVRRLGMGLAPDHGAAPLAMAAPEKAKDLREGATTAGGYLVPAEQSGEVLNLVNNYSAVKSLCRQVPMSAHQINFPTISEALPPIGCRKPATPRPTAWATARPTGRPRVRTPPLASWPSPPMCWR